MKISFTLNHLPVEMEVEPNQSLLNVLRTKGYHGAKKGCDTADCGSCTVLVNGKAVLSCLLLAPSVQGCTVTTIEGLSPKPDESQQERLYSPEQKAFADENAFQCGYCAPGLIMSTHELLSRYEELNAEEIRFHLSGNLCRCTGYEQQIQAVQNLFQKKKRGELG